MLPDKHNSIMAKIMGLIFSLFNVALVQDMSMALWETTLLANQTSVPFFCKVGCAQQMLLSCL